jgi:hypothetical protein
VDRPRVVCVCVLFLCPRLGELILPIFSSLISDLSCIIYLIMLYLVSHILLSLVQLFVFV